MMSDSTTSGRLERARSNPSRPSPALITSNPSISKLTRRSSTITGSSSITRTLGIPPDAIGRPPHHRLRAKGAQPRPALVLGKRSRLERQQVALDRFLPLAQLGFDRSQLPFVL